MFVINVYFIPISYNNTLCPKKKKMLSCPLNVISLNFLFKMRKYFDCF